MASAWVLWHRYGDGSGAHVERVYLNIERAQEDYQLITTTHGGASQSEWHLDEVPVVGRTS